MRVGFIGCGRHAIRTIYPAIAPAGLVLAATCARHLERAEQTALRFGANAAFDDPRRMLHESELDAVIIVVGAEQYGQLVRLALDAELPVFVEKPGCTSSTEGLELAEKARSSNVPLMVGYMKRFAPAYRRGKSIVEGQDFGRPTLASFTFAVGPWESEKASVRDYLLDNPVHHLDLARFLLGEVKNLQVTFTDAGAGLWAIGAVGTALSGTVVTFQFCTTASWSQRNETVEIFGEGHSMQVENVDTCIYRPADGPQEIWRPNYTVPLPVNFTGTTMGFVPELEHFVSVASGRVACESDMHSAAASLALAEEICALIGA